MFYDANNSTLVIPFLYLKENQLHFVIFVKIPGYWTFHAFLIGGMRNDQVQFVGQKVAV